VIYYQALREILAFTKRNDGKAPKCAYVTRPVWDQLCRELQDLAVRDDRVIPDPPYHELRLAGVPIYPETGDGHLLRF